MSQRWQSRGRSRRPCANGGRKRSWQRRSKPARSSARTVRLASRSNPSRRTWRGPRRANAGIGYAGNRFASFLKRREIPHDFDRAACLVRRRSMLRLFRAVSLRERRAHVGRALLIVAGVATGIALMVAFDVMNASVVTGFRQTFMALADVFARAQR